MPLNPLDALRQLHLFDSGPQVPAAVQDAQAEAAQQDDPAWKRVGRASMDSLVGGVKGFLGIGDQGPAGPTATNFGQLAQAALPFMGAVKGLKALPDIAPEAYGAVKGLKGKFYSRLTDAATRLPELSHPNKITSFLASQSAPEEASYRGLSDFLKSKGNQMVQREEVLKHLSENPIKLGERTLARPQPEAGEFRDPDSPKYSAYQVPGGEAYRENLTTLPPKQIPYTDALSGTEQTYPTNVYQSQHWDEPNVVVHSRSNERTLPLSEQDIKTYINDPNSDLDNPPMNGEKGRLIENVQSDWHQQGAKEGYQGVTQPAVPSEEDIRALRIRYEDAQQALRDRTIPLAEYMGVDPNADNFETDAHILAAMSYADDPIVTQHLNTLVPLQNAKNEIADAYYRAITKQTHTNLVPDAPFKKSWPDLALKQELYDTAQRPDLSWIGTTPGEELVKRGEGHSPAFNNEVIPNTLAKLLKPFGGGDIHTENISIPSKKYPNQNVHIWNNPEEHLRQIVDYSEPYGETVIATALPKGTSDATIDNAIAVRDTIRAMQAKPTALPFKMSMLTPEMKAAIVKRGFPIMSLLGLQAAQPQKEEQ